MSQSLYHITDKNKTNFLTTANVTRTVQEGFEERRKKTRVTPDNRKIKTLIPMKKNNFYFKFLLELRIFI